MLLALLTIIWLTGLIMQCFCIFIKAPKVPPNFAHLLQSAMRDVVRGLGFIYTHDGFWGLPNKIFLITNVIYATMGKPPVHRSAIISDLEILFVSNLKNIHALLSTLP